MHAFAISKISFRLLLSFTHETPNGFGKYIRCDNELNRFMSVHSWVQLHGTFSPIFKKKIVFALYVWILSFHNRICNTGSFFYICFLFSLQHFFLSCSVVLLCSLFLSSSLLAIGTIVIVINGLRCTLVFVHLNTFIHLHVLLQAPMHRAKIERRRTKNN